MAIGERCARIRWIWKQESQVEVQAPLPSHWQPSPMPIWKFPFKGVKWAFLQKTVHVHTQQVNTRWQHDGMDGRFWTAVCKQWPNIWDIFQIVVWPWAYHMTSLSLRGLSVLIHKIRCLLPCSDMSHQTKYWNMWVLSAQRVQNGGFYCAGIDGKGFVGEAGSWTWILTEGEKDLGIWRDRGKETTGRTIWTNTRSLEFGDACGVFGETLNVELGGGY